MNRSKKWIGLPPKYCDVCKADIKNVFVDGKTVFGCWANMCSDCHSQVGIGLGTGLGQLYERHGTDWVKRQTLD